MKILLAVDRKFLHVACMSDSTTRKQALETKLSSICGTAIEITVRGLNAFTISAEGNALKAIEKAKAFLMITGAMSEWRAEFDEECDFTCAYFNLHA